MELKEVLRFCISNKLQGGWDEAGLGEQEGAGLRTSIGKNLSIYN